MCGQTLFAAHSINAALSFVFASFAAKSNISLDGQAATPSMFDELGRVGGVVASRRWGEAGASSVRDVGAP